MKDLEGAIDTHLDRLKQQQVDPATLARVVSHLRYSLRRRSIPRTGVADRVSHYLGLDLRTVISR